MGVVSGPAPRRPTPLLGARGTILLGGGHFPKFRREFPGITHAVALANPLRPEGPAFLSPGQRPGYARWKWLRPEGPRSLAPQESAALQAASRWRRFPSPPGWAEGARPFGPQRLPPVDRPEDARQREFPLVRCDGLRVLAVRVRDDQEPLRLLTHVVARKRVLLEDLIVQPHPRVRDLLAVRTPRDTPRPRVVRELRECL